MTVVAVILTEGHDFVFTRAEGPLLQDWGDCFNKVVKHPRTSTVSHDL